MMCPENNAPSNRKIRVLAVDTHPIQYRVPLWRRLAKESCLDFHVLFGSDFSVRGYLDREFGVRFSWDVPLLEGYDYTIPPGSAKMESVSFFRPALGPVFQAVRRARPDVLICSAYLGAFWMGARLASDLTGAGVVFRHEASDEAHRSGFLRKMGRRMLLAWMYHGGTQFACTGQPAFRHLQARGIDSARMHFSPYCVDTEAVEAQRHRWLPHRRELRAGWGVGEKDRVLIFAGKLIPKKDPLLIARALALLSEKKLNRISWLVAGDGALQQALRETSSKILGSRFHFLGFCNQSRLGEVYAAADLLVLPSLPGAGETWGLVVNEALQWGIPAAVSDGVGCRHDLISPGQTGWIFPAGDEMALAGILASWVEMSPDVRAAMQTACRVRAAEFSLEKSAQGLLQAIWRAARPRQS